jgi:hypothetical protein
MLSEILSIVEKTNTRPLLIVFVSLSALVCASPETLQNPFTWTSTLLLLFALVAYALVWCWIIFIIFLNSLLNEADIASYGPLIGGALLSFCLLITFSYLGNHPEGLSFTLLKNPSTTLLLPLYLLSAETIKIKR